MLTNLVELSKDLFLDVHAFIDCLDNEIAIRQVFKVERGRQQTHHLFNLFAGVPPLGSRRFVIFADHTNAAIKVFLHHFDDSDRDTLLQEVHRDAATHGARTNHANLLDVAQLGILG